MEARAKYEVSLRPVTSYVISPPVIKLQCMKINRMKTLYSRITIGFTVDEMMIYLHVTKSQAMIT